MEKENKITDINIKIIEIDKEMNSHNVLVHGEK